ncbi:MAG: hypothetical protein GEV03_09325 [Streptosporangiales bacterium]|nr:hypothetical protein [Streptosporangiales bacterium]
MEFKERLEELRCRAEERRQAIQGEVDEFTAREFTGESGDGCVRVTVDGHGAVCGVRVDPRRLRAVMGDELGRKVVEAARAARGAYQEGTTDVLRRLSGGDAESFRRLGNGLDRGRR